jgi:hypothetical protein
MQELRNGFYVKTVGNREEDRGRFLSTAASQTSDTFEENFHKVAYD